MQQDRWLSVEEIAAHLGIKRETVYLWIESKQLPAHKMGRLWKFQKAEVDEWVRSGGAAPSKKKRGRCVEGLGQQNDGATRSDKSAAY